MVGGEVYYLFILYNGSCFIMLSVILVGAFFFLFLFSFLMRLCIYLTVLA